jgi:hypothetical protein
MDIEDMDIDRVEEIDEMENDDDYEDDHVIPSSSSMKPTYTAISALSAAVSDQCDHY